MSAREDLRQKLCMMMIHRGIQDSDVEIDAILGEYEVQDRTTEISIRSEDRNAYLFKKFISAKIVDGCTDRTIKFYSNTLIFVFARIDKTADSVEADDIRYYAAVRQKRDGVSKTTVNNEMRVLSSFYKYLQDEEIVLKNPMSKIGRIKHCKKKKSAFTDIEIEKIRNAARTSRERAIIETLLSTGCRVNELVNIKISDIDGDKIIVHGKGEKDRIVYLNAKSMIAVESYLKDRKDKNPYLFCGGIEKITSEMPHRKKLQEWYKYPEVITQDTHVDVGSIENLVRKIGKRSGLESSCYPHKFRRTCATMALRHGMPIEQVSKMLGHEEISTTQIYLDLDENDLAQAHKKYVV